MANNNIKDKVLAHIKKFAVTYLFVLISVFFAAVSGLDKLGVGSLVNQLVLRLTRNCFIVLALIIPIVAGMGINFAITIGAMAAQIGMLLALNWGVSGWLGILLAAGITLPLGMLFGFLIGRLLNKMKGQETIGSMILGYFANGAYQLLFLFIFGNLIPLNSNVTIVGATGVKNTLSLMGDAGLYMAVDSILRIDFLTAVYGAACAVAVVLIVLLILKKLPVKRFITGISITAVITIVFCLPSVKCYYDGSLNGSPVRLPVITWLLIALLCGFNAIIMKTRLGQKFRAVGHNRVVANASGINVNRVRIIAIMISTVLAGWGQILFMQSEGIGTFQTYAAHEQVGLYAGAAILVGGASIDRATNSQAIIGTFLFHFLFITAMSAATKLFGDSAVGEYFRAFISYGIIALALVIYTWRNVASKRRPEAELKAAPERAKGLKATK